MRARNQLPPTALLPGLTGLVVMVPEAEIYVPAAHITLLAPFGADCRPTEAELDEVARFCKASASFAFSLDGEATFPDGTRYLTPSPRTRFSRLTHDLHQLFPEYPPYGGTFDLVVPHLTIPSRLTVPRTAGLPDVLGERLAAEPVESYAEEVVLLRRDGDGDGDGPRYTRLDVFPLGSSAA